MVQFKFSYSLLLVIIILHTTQISAQEGEGPWSDCKQSPWPPYEKYCTNYANETVHCCTEITLYAFCCDEEVEDFIFYTYQWQRQVYLPGGWDWRDISDATSKELTLTYSEGFTMGPPYYRCNIKKWKTGMPPILQESWATGEVYIEFDKEDPSIANSSSSGTYEYCAGDNVNFNMKLNTGDNCEYKWYQSYDDGATWQNVSTNPSLSFTAKLEDDNTRYYCYIYNACNSISSSVIQLIVYPKPTIFLGADKHLCTGKSTLIDAGAGYTSYKWNTGDTTQSIEVSDQANYSVVVTDNNDCINEDDINIILDPVLPQINLGEDAAYCPQDKPVLDAGPNFDHYNWSTGSTERSITVTESGTYHVTATKDGNVCESFDKVDVTIAQPYNKEEICIVTIDRTSGKNLIVWEKTPNIGIEAYNIHRETSVMGDYELMGTKGVAELSIFLDEETDPEEQQFLYKITAIDTCGNESDIASSPYHKPLFLQYNSSIGGVNLEWAEYEIEKRNISFKTYEILRGSDSTALNKINDVSASKNVYIDKDPNALLYRYYYRVVGVLDTACYPNAIKKVDSGPFSYAYSNVENNRMTIPAPDGINNQIPLLITINPNPFSQTTLVKFNNTEGSNYMLSITDFSGKLCRIVNDIITSDYILERKDLEPGIYFIELRGPRIYRGKIIIE